MGPLMGEGVVVRRQYTPHHLTDQRERHEFLRESVSSYVETLEKSSHICSRCL